MRSTVSTARVVAGREDDGKMVSCVASNIVQPATPGVATVRLQVSYKPGVSIETRADQATSALQEGEDLHLACQVDAQPSHVKLYWTLGGVDVTPAKDPHVLILKNISKAENNKDVLCRATNTVGTGDDTLVLSVNCK